MYSYLQTDNRHVRIILNFLSNPTFLCKQLDLLTGNHMMVKLSYIHPQPLPDPFFHFQHFQVTGRSP